MHLPQPELLKPRTWKQPQGGTPNLYGPIFLDEIRGSEQLQTNAMITSPMVQRSQHFQPANLQRLSLSPLGRSEPNCVERLESFEEWEITILWGEML